LGNLGCRFGVFACGVRAISEAEGCDRSSTGSISGILRSAAPSEYSGHLIGTTKFLQFIKDNAMIIDFIFLLQASRATIVENTPSHSSIITHSNGCLA